MVTRPRRYLFRMVIFVLAVAAGAALLGRPLGGDQGEGALARDERRDAEDSQVLERVEHVAVQPEGEVEVEDAADAHVEGNGVGRAGEVADVGIQLDPL